MKKFIHLSSELKNTLKRPFESIMKIGENEVLKVAYSIPETTDCLKKCSNGAIISTFIYISM
jgi:hypothetical protein